MPVHACMPATILPYTCHLPPPCSVLSLSVFFCLYSVLPPHPKSIVIVEWMPEEREREEERGRRNGAAHKTTHGDRQQHARLARRRVATTRFSGSNAALPAASAAAIKQNARRATGGNAFNMASACNNSSALRYRERQNLLACHAILARRHGARA